MSWKSTIDITREEAIRLIIARANTVDSLSNETLGSILIGMGYGDNQGLQHYGHNFRVTGISPSKLPKYEEEFDDWDDYDDYDYDDLYDDDEM